MFLCHLQRVNKGGTSVTHQHLDKFMTPPNSATIEDIRAAVKLDTSSAEYDMHGKVAGAPVSTDPPLMCICQHCNTKCASQDTLIQHQKFNCLALLSNKKTRSPRNRFRKLLSNFGKFLQAMKTYMHAD